MQMGLVSSPRLPKMGSTRDSVLADLRARLARARFPSQVRGAGWSYGANLTYLRELVEKWLDANDWRAQEALLKRMPQ